MTTSDPRTGQHDNPHEHRGLGKRILDAVLGDPAEQRHDDPTADRPADRTANRPPDFAAPTPTGADRPGESRAGGAPAGYAGEGPRSEHASYEQAMRDSAPGGVVQDDRGTGQGGTGQAGYPDPREASARRRARPVRDRHRRPARRRSRHRHRHADGHPARCRVRPLNSCGRRHGAMPVTTTRSPEPPVTTPATPVVTPSLRTPRTPSIRRATRIGVPRTGAPASAPLPPRARPVQGWPSVAVPGRTS